MRFPLFSPLFLKPYQNKRIAVIFFLGIFSGIPFLLTGSTFHFWLAQEGVRYTDIGYLSLVGLPYTLKFLWAPLVDQAKIPYLTSWLGQRRAWLCLSQTMLAILLIALGSFDPKTHLVTIALLAVGISFMSALQDITMLVYQVERLKMSSYGAGEAAGIFGYRLGLLMGGAGALYLSSLLTWGEVYALMALSLSGGILTTLLCREPSPTETLVIIPVDPSGGLAGLLKRSFLKPFQNFSQLPQWLLILGVMFFYKLGDNFISSWPNQYYLSLGFTKIDIANASKIFGMMSSVIGGYFGGVILYNYGIIKSLFWLLIVHAVAMGGYLVLGLAGHNLVALYLTIAVEDLTGGMRVTALFAYQMMLCAGRGHAAVQLALLTSLVHCGRVVCAAPSGWILDHTSWTWFFGMSIALNLIPLVLVWKLRQAS